jgi:hypothetical protein
MAQRVGAVVLAIGIAAVSGFGALVGTAWGFGLKCDDSCGTPPPWRDDPNAWQWGALGWVAIGGFLCALLLVLVVALGRTVAAAAALGSWTILGFLFLKLLRDSGLTSNPGRGWMALSALALAGMIAVALTSPTSGRT